jgi:hypothetical protein
MTIYGVESKIARAESHAAKHSGNRGHAAGRSRRAPSL